MFHKYRKILKSFAYSLVSNLISLLISMLAVIIVPKLIGIEEYGYWQLYIFYSAYLGLLHFGWSDGIYLKEGGKLYKDIDKIVIFNQVILLSIMQIIIAIVISSVASKFIFNDSKLFILLLLTISMVVTNIRSVPIFILQATNRIKDFSNIIIIDRISYLLLVILILLMGLRSFQALILAEIIGRIISLLISFYYCKEIIFRPITDFNPSFLESYNFISSGIKLMLAYTLSLFVIGIVRLGIENVWDIEVFGKISLSLSASSLMMIFINALGVILFPLLRRINSELLPKIYSSFRSILIPFLLGLLIFYYPIKSLLELWLPGYASSLKYMSLLFPIFVFEGNTGLLINTYMKTMRKEGLMLRINSITLLLSIGLTVLNAFVLKNLELTVISIVFLLAFKSIYSEIILTSILNIKLIEDFILELTLIIIFIFTGWFINSWMSTFIYGSSYLIYFLLKKDSIGNTLSYFINQLDIRNGEIS